MEGERLSELAQKRNEFTASKKLQWQNKYNIEKIKTLCILEVLWWHWLPMTTSKEKKRNVEIKRMRHEDCGSEDRINDPWPNTTNVYLLKVDGKPNRFVDLYLKLCAHSRCEMERTSSKADGHFCVGAR